MKIAQALTLRKQLEAKVKQLEPLKPMGEQGLFEIKTKRQKISDDTDEVTFQIPKITLAEFTKEYDKFASALRQLDTAIQKANWEAEVDFTDEKNPFDATFPKPEVKA